MVSHTTVELAYSKLGPARNLGHLLTVVYPGVLFRGGGSTNSVEDRGQREWGSGDGSPPSQEFWRQL